VQTFIDTEFDLDEDSLVAERDQTAPDIIGDQDIRVLLRENRIALASGSVTTVPTPDGEPALYDLPLSCVVHAHPRCTIEWSRLLVDLSPTDGARISDMSPREVSDTNPVELTTTVGVGLKFEILSKVVSAEVHPELTRKSTVYFPQIVSSGPGFVRGYWDFLSTNGRYLHVDRELRLLITAPRDQPVQARFQLRARVNVRGLAGVIPLLARGGTIDQIHTLIPD
jgi:hypothetical protein